MSFAQVYPPLLQRASYSCFVLPRATCCLPSLHAKSASQLQHHSPLVTSSSTCRDSLNTQAGQSRTYYATHVRGQDQEYDFPKSMGKNETGQYVDLVQMVGKHRKRYTSVYVWGFTYTGALGVPSYFFPSQRKNPIRKPKKFQPIPYKLKFDEKVSL